MTATDGSSVGVRVRAARRWLRAARLAESALLAAAAFLGVMAATAGSGAAPIGGAALAVAALGAACAGGAYALFHRESPARVARRLDKALGMDGALLTAFEVERDERAAPLALLLPPRVAARVPARVATRTLLPRSMPLVALPFIAGAALYLALDVRARTDPRRELEAHGARLSGAGGRLRSALAESDVELSSAERTAALALAAQAAALRAPQADDELGRETRAAVLDELRERAEELAGELPAGSAARRELQELATDAEAALRSLAARTPTATSASAPPEAQAAEAGGEGDARGEGGAGLTPGDPEGRMSGRPAPDELSGAPLDPDPTPAAAGLAGRRPLPAAHARVVTAWIEARAARAAAPASH